MTKPMKLGRVAPLLTAESVDGSYSGDDVDFDGGGYAGEASVNDQWKQPVRVASTATLTISTGLNAGDTIDGVTLASGDRVLLKDQSTASQNGIYIAGTTPVRAPDFDDDDEVLGAIVYVIAGTTNTATAWKVTNTAAVTVGSTSIVFASFGAGGSSSFATPAIVLGSSAAAGAASTVIRSDSTIAAFDATSPTTQALGDSAVVGTAAFAARRDHKHAMPTAAVTTSGLTQATGKLLGRSTASTGAIEEITVGTGLSLSAGSLTATGGASSLTVEEVDGSPTDSAVTKIVFPNGTLGIASHVATYTPAAAAAGALVLLQTQTASASATLDFTGFVNSSLYDNYLFVLQSLVPGTNNVDLWMRVSTNGGSSYAAGGADYDSAVFAWAKSGTGNSGTTTGQMTARGVAEIGNTASKGGVSGCVWLFTPASSSIETRVSGSFTYWTSQAVRSEMGAQYLATTAVDAFRFMFGSGTIASGVIRVYGITK